MNRDRFDREFVMPIWSFSGTLASHCLRDRLLEPPDRKAALCVSKADGRAATGSRAAQSGRFSGRIGFPAWQRSNGSKPSGGHKLQRKNLNIVKPQNLKIQWGTYVILLRCWKSGDFGSDARMVEISGLGRKWLLLIKSVGAILYLTAFNDALFLYLISTLCIHC